MYQTIHISILLECHDMFCCFPSLGRSSGNRPPITETGPRRPATSPTVGLRRDTVPYPVQGLAFDRPIRSSQMSRFPIMLSDPGSLASPTSTFYHGDVAPSVSATVRWAVCRTTLCPFVWLTNILRATPESESISFRSSTRRLCLRTPGCR